MPNGFNAMHNFEGGNAEMPDGRHEYLANARARMDHVGRWLREPRYRDFTANREHMSDLYHRFQTGANLAARARYNEGVDRWQHNHIHQNWSDNTMSPVWGPRREFQGTRNYNNYIYSLNYGAGDRGSYSRNGWVRSTPSFQDIEMYNQFQQMNRQPRYPMQYGQRGPGMRRGPQMGVGGTMEQGGDAAMQQQMQELARQFQMARTPQQRQQIMKQMQGLAGSTGRQPAIRVAGWRSDVDEAGGSRSGMTDRQYNTIMAQKTQYEEDMRQQSIRDGENIHTVMNSAEVNTALVSVAEFNRTHQQELGAMEPGLRMVNGRLQQVDGPNPAAREQLRKLIASLDTAFQNKVTPDMLRSAGFVIGVNTRLRDNVGPIVERAENQTIGWILRLRNGHIVLDNAQRPDAGVV